MDLSVVIPTMNKAVLLRRTLAALHAQEIRPGLDWEIVVVNDGSTDETAPLLDGEMREKLANLVVVAPPQNVGRARARNLGVQAASGKWVLFLDDDIIAPPDLLEAHLNLLASHPGWGTIGRVVTDPDIIDGPLFHYLDSRGVGRAGSGQAPARFFVTQNAAVPRQAFLDVGGFDPSFGLYGFEDMEVAFRLEDRAGVRFLALNSPAPRHVHHHSLAQYWAKKVDCGRDSLPRLAGLHPERTVRMRLHHAVDVPGQRAPSLLTILVRRLAETNFILRFGNWLGSWPTGEACRPLAAPLYCRLMNLAVLCYYRRGVAGLANISDKRAE